MPRELDYAIFPQTSCREPSSMLLSFRRPRSTFRLTTLRALAVGMILPIAAGAGLRFVRAALARRRLQLHIRRNWPAPP
jgi:hypothetical protein